MGMILTLGRLFAFSALLMALSTGLLRWMYMRVNKREVQEWGDGSIHLRQRGNVDKRD